MAIAQFNMLTVANTAGTYTLANYKQYGGDFSAALTAIGITKTSDTGQVNWSTVAAVPTAFGTDYEIRQFTDSLQSSAPFYIRFDFATPVATGTGAGAWATFRIRIGTGTDGAGNLTGSISDFFYMTAQSSSGTSNPTTAVTYLSSDGSRLQIIWVPNQTVPSANIGAGGLSIERLRDSSGNALATGLQISMETRSTLGKTAQVLFQPVYGYAYPATALAWTAAIPASGTASFGGTIGLFPVLPNLGYPGNPGIGLLAYFQTDSPTPGAIIPVSIYGVSRNYMTPFSAAGLFGTSLNGNSAIVQGLYLYQ
jgi:hypothetical protein